MCVPTERGEDGACEQQDVGPPPQGEEAVAVLSGLLTDLGVDVDAHELMVEATVEESWTLVSAHLLVDGRRTGLQWSLTLSGAGVQSLYGHLAPVVPLGEYDVVSPAEAVARLNDPRFSPTGRALPFDTGLPRGPELPGQQDMELPEPLQPGADVHWPVADVEIVEARLVTTLHTQRDGAAVLAPTYELVSDDGGTWTVVAVDEDHLDLEVDR
jgi:hypothetical protein